MRIAILITFLTVVMAGCGIFTPRNQFEEPLFIIETDRFSFSKLLENSGENFTSLHLDELFTESFTYKDINSRGGLPYDKNQIKDRLRQIESEYPDLRIEWVDSSFTRKGDSIFLEQTGYAVFLDKNSLAPDFTGSSNFALARSTGWQICRWIDMPSGNEKSFFAPQE
ncbi:MAG TPA: hypothetical protein PLE24_03385 [Chitinispirillaceae bacterium]|jgi:hypothetical protein|nr:hypothetical protein [Chitinispirillaceae bacterium]